MKVRLSGGRSILFARAAERNVIAWVIATPDGEVARVADPGGAGAIAARIAATYERFAS